jgi:hypothetical protein
MEVEIKRFTDILDCVEDKKTFNRSNYFKFRDTTTLIAIKISRSLKPFFGIGKQVIDFANSNDDKFYLVLLISDKSGWVYSKNEVNSNIKNGFWKYREEDNNYKINKGDLSDANCFTSHNIFLSKINYRGGKGDTITHTE